MWSGTVLLLPCAVVMLASCNEPARDPEHLSLEALMDPLTCAGCHPSQYEQWASSMHAYAGDDPVFLAMNRRGQREADIGTFCVECHAPMAVRTGATDDGLNLDELPASLKGVTCYFCHNAVSVNGTHNAPISLGNDHVMRGSFDDAAPTAAHASAYSPLLDRDRLESSQLCGACHDIVNARGVHLERTFDEWRSSVYANPEGGTTCGQCHMPRSATPSPVVADDSAPSRRSHSHLLPGVDLAITPFPDRDVQANAVQELLDTTLQSALCVRGGGEAAEIQVVLDNVGAGHHFPSGSSQDRRAWIEVVAYARGEVIYQSGVVAAGQPVVQVDDPDLWLIRDCMLDDQGREVHMFWEAHDVESNLLPAQLTFDPGDPRYYQSHVFRRFPLDGMLEVYPDRVTLDVRLRPFDLAVFDDLAASGDLQAADGTSVEQMREALPTLSLGQQLEWTPDSVSESYVERLLPVTCVSHTNLRANVDKVPAPRRSRCAP